MKLELTQEMQKIILQAIEEKVKIRLTEEVSKLRAEMEENFNSLSETTLQAVAEKQ